MASATRSLLRARLAAPAAAVAGASAAAVSVAAGAAARHMSVLATRSYTSHDDDMQVFPNNGAGLDYDLNWSLAADGLTTRGEAWRNADVRTLLQALPRSEVKISKERSVEVVGGALAKANETTAFATDAFPGRKVMDVEEYEGRLQSLRRDCLSYAPRLFVEDGAVGSSRAAELRVRVVTDSPVVALYFRSLLHRIPLYAPEAFPRTLTVYAATLAGSGLSAWEGVGKPYTVVDVDPSAARGTVAAAGPVSLAALRDAVAAAAGQLQALGGYRHVPGGIQNPAMTDARKEGVLHFYMRDGHVYADKNEPHPDLLSFRGDVIVGADGRDTALVVGPLAGELAAAAAGKGRLYAAHAGVWGTSSVSSAWAGVSVPAGAAKANAKAFPLGRGTLVAQGQATVPVAAGKQVAAPSKVIIVGGSGADNAAKFAEAAGLTAKQVEKVAARLGAAGLQVSAVASEAEAVKALGL